MTTSTMKLPASYAVIDAEEMTYLDGGASSAYQSFLDVGKVFNYIARIFSGASSIINNVNVIYQSFVSLNSLLTLASKRLTPKFAYGSRAFFRKSAAPVFSCAQQFSTVVRKTSHLKIMNKLFKFLGSCSRFWGKIHTKYKKMRYFFGVIS